MTEDPTTLFGAEHVRRYRETGGEVGHIWKEVFYDPAGNLIELYEA